MCLGFSDVQCKWPDCLCSLGCVGLSKSQVSCGEKATGQTNLLWGKSPISEFRGEEGIYQANLCLVLSLCLSVTCLLNGAIRRTKDENTFPYVLTISYYQKQFPVSGRLLLCMACKWWPRTAVWCHPTSLLCRAWWVRINAINGRVSLMGKAMKQCPKQELATLQIISPQLIVSSDQKAMTVLWPALPLMWDGLQALVQPLARGKCGG